MLRMATTKEYTKESELGGFEQRGVLEQIVALAAIIVGTARRNENSANGAAG